MTDPRSLIYPGHDEGDKTPSTNEELVDTDSRDKTGDRRTGTNDELKELDRVERRKK
jgi:hypothetical protein